MKKELLETQKNSSKEQNRMAGFIATGKASKTEKYEMYLKNGGNLSNQEFFCTNDRVQNSDNRSNRDSPNELLGKIVEDFKQENTEAVKEQLNQLAEGLYKCIPTTNIPVLSDKAIDLMITLFFGLLEEGKKTSDYGNLTMSHALGLMKKRKLNAFFKKLPSESIAKDQYNVLFSYEGENFKNIVIELTRDCLEKVVQLEKVTSRIGEGAEKPDKMMN